MDIIVPIRVRASELLGELHGVGEDYLVQVTTLSTPKRSSDMLD